MLHWYNTMYGNINEIYFKAGLERINNFNVSSKSNLQPKTGALTSEGSNIKTKKKTPVKNNQHVTSPTAVVVADMKPRLFYSTKYS